MLFFDQLKKNDPQLRLLALTIAGGFGILLVGLWWVQIVSAREYESHLVTQSYRTVRIPAVRGKILDRHGKVLAENLPQYDLVLYLGELRGRFDDAYDQLHAMALRAQKRAIAAREKEIGRSLTKEERKPFELNLNQLREKARFQVASNLVAKVSRKLEQPIPLDRAKFERACNDQRALPYVILSGLNETQIARFEEQYAGGLGVDLAVQSERFYPHGTLAGHVLGYLVRDNRSEQGEDAYFSYRLPDYRGVVGIEGGFDKELRGRAGAEAVLVNNLGYRQSTTILNPPRPGHNVVTTLDLGLEKAATDSIVAHQGADVRAAVVVMDVHTGDILAMVSSPAINPDFSKNSAALLSNTNLLVQYNRATQVPLAAGSIFKPIVGLAALKAGLNPNALVDNPGYVYVGQRHIRDLAPPGQYNFQRAIAYSCNTYFITVGLRAGITNIVRMAEEFHFGERTGLPTWQETPGIFPTLKEVENPRWHDGDSANICIGQGEMAVTPIQIAVAYSAIANGGTVLWPRLVERIEPQDPDSGEKATVFPSGIVRSKLDVSEHDLRILREAMLKETEEGTGQAAQVPGLQICGKTGTAQVMNSRHQEIDRNTWFASFAPYRNPRYAVVVMMEGRTFWGATCAEIAHDIYQEIVNHPSEEAPATLARN